MNAKVWFFLLLMWSTSYSAVIAEQMFSEDKCVDLFMPGILVLWSLECTSLNGDEVDVAIRNEGRLHSCKPWAPGTHMCQEAGDSHYFFPLYTQEWTRLCITGVSEAQSPQRPTLLHRCDLNLTSNPKLPFVTVGDKMPARTDSKQHDLSPWFSLNWVNIDVYLLLNRFDAEVI